MVEYKTDPFNHQKEEVEKNWRREAHALFWEQGCGKTKPVLDQAARLIECGEIDGVVVVAPNGVHTNWALDEIPAHFPDSVAERTSVFYWRTAKKGTKWHRQDAEVCLKHDGPAILCTSYDAVMTQPGAVFMRKFMDKRRVMLVLDEAHKIKTPSAKRTRRVTAAGKHAPYRRLLTGTPISNSPFDVFTQVRFIKPDAWLPLGVRTFQDFKTFFGIWQRKITKTNDSYEVCVAYRNLHLLKDVVAQVGTRLLKEDVLDLPPKLYSKRYFELAPEQRRVYEELQQECAAVLASGELISAPHVIVRLQRLQQVASNYLKDESGNIHRLTEKNPRMRVLMDVVEDTSGKMLVWAKYHQDIDDIVVKLRNAGIKAVVYDGRCSDEDKTRARREFQEGDAQVFVGNAAAAGTGLTLHAAKTVVYYNNTYNLLDRQQSEDRAHRAGMDEHPVTYIDLVGADTIDEAILQAHRNKVELSQLILSDPQRGWI